MSGDARIQRTVTRGMKGALDSARPSLIQPRRQEVAVVIAQLRTE